MGDSASRDWLRSFHTLPDPRAHNTVHRLGNIRPLEALALQARVVHSIHRSLRGVSCPHTPCKGKRIQSPHQRYACHSVMYLWVATAAQGQPECLAASVCRPGAVLGHALSLH